MRCQFTIILFYCESFGYKHKVYRFILKRGIRGGYVHIAEVKCTSTTHYVVKNCCQIDNKQPTPR